MIRILTERIKNEWAHASIRLHHQDVLTFTPPSHAYSVIANIPYYITSPILFHFLYPTEGIRTPDAMTILMQKEVGEKILAKKGKKIQHSALSLAMHIACESIESLAVVPSMSFDPAPKVDSIILRFVLRTERDRTLEQRLISLWNDAFGQPRKTLLANLKRAGYDSDTITESLKELNHSALVRAEALSLDDWKYLL